MASYLTDSDNLEKEQAETKAKLRTAVLKELMCTKVKLEKHGLLNRFADAAVEKIERRIRGNPEANQLLATELAQFTALGDKIEDEVDDKETPALLRASRSWGSQELDGSFHRAVMFFGEYNEMTSHPVMRPGPYQKDDGEESEDEELDVEENE